MIEAKHHIPNEILVAYSTGTLPEAFSIIVACHISLCDKCRVEVEALDAVGLLRLKLLLLLYIYRRVKCGMQL